MHYPIAIHKDFDTDYGVTVPDLPGCFSAGDTLDDALVEAVEAIECHIEGLLLDNEPIPAPKNIEDHRDNINYADAIWAVVQVDLSKLSGKSKRVNITVPERLLSIIDLYASQHGATRSGLIAEATVEYIANRRSADE